MDLLKATQRNIKLENAKPWWNTWILVQEIHLHLRQTSTKNEQIPAKSTRSRMDDQRKDHIDPEGPSQGNRPKHLQTFKVPTDDVQNINGTNKRSDLQLANKPLIVPWRTEGCRKGSRGTEELLYIDQHIFNEIKTRRKNLAMVCIDYKKAYDMLLQSWIINCFKMYKISDEVINFIEKTMKTCKVELTAGGRSLAEAKIQRSLFQGYAQSPLLFIIAMMPLNHILRKCRRLWWCNG